MSCSCGASSTTRTPRCWISKPSAGWGATRTIVQFGAVATLLTAFILIEWRTAQPLIRLGFLRNPALVGAALVAASILGTYMSFQFIGGRYLQSTRGWSPLEMAMGFLPCGLRILPTLLLIGVAFVAAVTMVATLIPVLRKRP